ncbi:MULTISPECIES: peptidoglycan-binding domain-containing protein [Nostocales]|uniref:Peptidoglycan-binding protein n=3 Tax=Nostocales TaxID=1161 RepID=A0A8S9TC16_9CYAN|nr:peptidoglycan-binding protein [Tolypothrix bouteillei]KAF3888973.1 peptidoglycan-binding protein [Tolypothrix bouteillei VB521301]
MPAIIQYPTQRPTLQFGAFGQIVKEMQKALNQRLVQLDTVSACPMSVPTTGYFDRQTQNAVKYLQCLAFLTVDGIVGEETWNYLYKGSDSLPKLSIGSHGSVVQALQEALKAGGYYSGTVDGVFEAKTENAVRAFQAEHYLVSNGIIESRTWRMLSKLEVHACRCNINAFSG